MKIPRVGFPRNRAVGFTLLLAGVVAVVQLAATDRPRSEIGSFSPTGLADAPPILILPGWGDTDEEIERLRTDLETSLGPHRREIRVFSFADPEGSNVDHANEIERAIAGVLGSRPSAAPSPALGPEVGAVDVIAYSMSGLALREYLRRNPTGHRVGRVVFLGTPHEGTVTAAVAWGEGADEMEPWSAFLGRLPSSGAALEDVEVLSLWTPLDLRVIPPRSAAWPPGRTRRVCCPTHRGLLDDPEVVEIIAEFLGGSPSARGVGAGTH